jgi:hypothetical protein
VEDAGGEGVESEHGQDKGDEMSSCCRGGGEVRKFPCGVCSKGVEPTL